MMYFFAPWQNQTERELMWTVKAAKLQPANYSVASLGKNITVQKGWWFSAHETWKYLFLPYSQVQITRDLLRNGEKARTWDAHSNSLPGMFASVNGNLTRNNETMQYLSACGIQEIAFETVSCRYLVTPYSTMGLFLAN